MRVNVFIKLSFNALYTAHVSPLFYTSSFTDHCSIIFEKKIHLHNFKVFSMFSTRFQYFFVLTKYINTLILSINGPFPSIIREHRSHNKVHLPSQYLILGDLTFRRKQNYYCFVKLPSDQALFLRAYICLNCLIKVCKLLFFGKFCFSNKGQIP